ncbi:unnamed protein product [Amoebophrya sp. A120]|nr:unnamed protein product [Amoebophrya sp. A120]|eukprot:GSA120T00010118001.1
MQICKPEMSPMRRSPMRIIILESCLFGICNAPIYQHDVLDLWT